MDGQPLLITMTGKVDGDAIAGKADFGGFAEGDWSAKRAKPGAAAAAATPTPATTTADNSHVDHRLLRDHGGRRLRRQMGRGA